MLIGQSASRRQVGRRDVLRLRGDWLHAMSRRGVRNRRARMAKAELWRPPRMCDDYWSEWKHCRSVGNLFHHYYAYGEFPSCKQWKTDYNNCREWEKHKSGETKKALRESEKKRLEEQKRHLPVWEMRKNPPAEWHLPLNDGKGK